MARRASPCATCALRALGGDTVSPWDTKDSLCYFQSYTLEVGVDFYCPHGRAYAENYRFEYHNPSATIWHEGPGNRHAKTVVRNYTFTDNDGFKLKRFPHEAQAYLVGYRFTTNMADIYHTASGPVGTARVPRRLPPPGRRRSHLDTRQPDHSHRSSHRHSNHR